MASSAGAGVSEVLGAEFESLDLRCDRQLVRCGLDCFGEENRR